MKATEQGNQQGSKKGNLLFFDILICFVLPLILWRAVAPQIGDRNTILLIACIGIIYSVFDFLKYRQFNFIVVYSLFLSISSNIISLVTINTEQLMTNFVMFNIFTIALQLLLWRTFKPVPMLYFLNGAMRLGYSKEDSNFYFKQDFFRKPFILMAFVYIGKDVFDALIRVYFLNNYSDAAYSNMAQISSTVGMAYTIAITYWGYMLISKGNQLEMAPNEPLNTEE